VRLRLHLVKKISANVPSIPRIGAAAKNVCSGYATPSIALLEFSDSFILLFQGESAEIGRGAEAGGGEKEERAREVSLLQLWLLVF
jgi:hypothetical protein